MKSFLHAVWSVCFYLIGLFFVFVLFLGRFWPGGPCGITWPKEKSSETNKHPRLEQALAKMWHCNQFNSSYSDNPSCTDIETLLLMNIIFSIISGASLFLSASLIVDPLYLLAPAELRVKESCVWAWFILPGSVGKRWIGCIKMAAGQGMNPAKTLFPLPFCSLTTPSHKEF